MMITIILAYPFDTIIDPLYHASIMNDIVDPIVNNFYSEMIASTPYQYNHYTGQTTQNFIISFWRTKW